VGKPLIWAGNGIRLNGEVEQFRKYVDESGIPFVTTWTGADLLPTDHPLNVGIVGVSGHVGANKAVHEADAILVRGSGEHTTQIGANLPTQRYLLDYDWRGDVDKDWVERCQELKKEKVPLVGSYLFNDKMTRMLPRGVCMVIDGGGTALYTGFQSSYIKEGSRLICSTAISAMGSGLPEAVGACVADGSKLTTCLIGDGSLMLNLQELQTIKHHNLPIKIFVLNNGGYLAIKHTQMSFLGGRLHGVGLPDISFPSTEKLAAAFEIPYLKLREPYDEEAIGTVLDLAGPTICEVMVPEDQKIVGQGFRKEGEKFYPLPLSEMAV
jgi:acetolactate synthase-1/2/3 large subunit